jgi:hypothetical protein
LRLLLVSDLSSFDIFVDGVIASGDAVTAGERVVGDVFASCSARLSSRTIFSSENVDILPRLLR